MLSDSAPRERARQAVRQAAGAGPARNDVETLRRRTLNVLDTQLAQRPRGSRARHACAKGCSMCCHLRVMATAAEVLGLAAYMERTLSRAAFDEFATRVATTAAAIHALPRERVLLTNVPCPLLVDGACSVYPARPFNCRAYHSLDVTACRESFLNPDDVSLTHPQSALEARIHEGAQQGFIDLLRLVEADPAQYELVTALDETLRDPETRHRFERGEAVYRRALRL